MTAQEAIAAMKAEIKRRIADYERQIEELESRDAILSISELGDKQAELQDLLSFLDTLEQEPNPSKSVGLEGLDEVAEEYGKKHTFCPDEWTSTKEIADILACAVRFGAAWMAGQGVTCGGRIMKASTGETYAESDYVPLDGKCGDKVVVQIRKKED